MKIRSATRGRSGVCLPLAAAIVMIGLGGCHSRSALRTDGGQDLPTASGGSGSGGAGAAAGQGGRGGAGAAAGQGAGAGGASGRGGGGGSFTVPGPCLERMECNGNDPGGSMQFHCVCQGGSWICPEHDVHGWLTSDLPLPVADPQPSTACHGTNYACTLPDRCGTLCVCNQVGQWVCQTLQTDADGGAVVVDGVPDAGSPNSAAAGCSWPPCVADNSTPPPATHCFTPICFSTILPSGSVFFMPGGAGCASEH